MKKLARKLFLSCAALAACATTLVSTTFAWYTSNTEVNTNAVTGTSKANGDSLLLISTTGADGTYGPSADISLKGVETLVPVAYTAATNINGPTFKTLDLTIGEATVNTTVASDVISFDLYFRGMSGASGVPVIIKNLTVENTTGTLPSKDILAPADSNNKVIGMPNFDPSTTTTYTADILRVLDMAYVTETITKEAGSDAVPTYGKTEMYALEGLKNTFTDGLASAGAFDAHEYYKAATGKTLATYSPALEGNPTAITPGTTEINLGTTPASTATGNSLHVKFYLFINGWDKACFDAVQSQTFTVKIDFTSVANTKVNTPAGA